MSNRQLVSATESETPFGKTGRFSVPTHRSDQSKEPHLIVKATYTLGRMSKYMRATEVLLRSFSTNTFDRLVKDSNRTGSPASYIHLAHESSGPRDEDSLVPVELSHWGLHRALHGPTSPERKVKVNRDKSKSEYKQK